MPPYTGILFFSSHSLPPIRLALSQTFEKHFPGTESIHTFAWKRTSFINLKFEKCKNSPLPMWQWHRHPTPCPRVLAHYKTRHLVFTGSKSIHCKFQPQRTFHWSDNIHYQWAHVLSGDFLYVVGSFTVEECCYKMGWVLWLPKRENKITVGGMLTSPGRMFSRKRKT